MIFKTKSEFWNWPGESDYDEGDIFDYISNSPSAITIMKWGEDRGLDLQYFCDTDWDDDSMYVIDYDFIKVHSWYIPNSMKDLIVEFKLTFGSSIITQ